MPHCWKSHDSAHIPSFQSQRARLLGICIIVALDKFKCKSSVKQNWTRPHRRVQFYLTDDLNLYKNRQDSFLIYKIPNFLIQHFTYFSDVSYKTFGPAD